MKIAVSAKTRKTDLLAAELYNWCGEMLEKIRKYNAETDEKLYVLLYKLLTVMYKCSKENKPLLLHENHRRVIEDLMSKALASYFATYQNYQNELLKLDQKQEMRSSNLSRHMFCKYPFLKSILK